MGRANHHQRCTNGTRMSTAQSRSVVLMPARWAGREYLPDGQQRPAGGQDSRYRCQTDQDQHGSAAKLQTR